MVEQNLISQTLRRSDEPWACAGELGHGWRYQPH